MSAAGSLPANLRTQAFLHGPIVSTLIRLSWPNILVMLAQASTGLIETWWVSHLGTDALAGMAIVFPVVMLMQMMSQGAMGGGISSAIARALGAGRHEEADALVLHAIVINVVFGAFFAVAVLGFGPSLYRALGGQGGSLEAALRYSNVVFGGVILLWVMNGLASVIRGTGNMLVPAMVMCGGVFVLVPLSPLLIFGIGPFPALRHCRRRSGAGAVLRRRNLVLPVVYPQRAERGASALGQAAMAAVPGNPADRHGGGDHLAADQPDGPRSPRPWLATGSAPRTSPATAPVPGLSIFSPRWSSASAEPWSPWLA